MLGGVVRVVRVAVVGPQVHCRSAVGEVDDRHKAASCNC